MMWWRTVQLSSVSCNLFCHALHGCFAQTLMAAGHRVISSLNHTIQDDNLAALPSRLFHPNETLTPISIAVSHKWNPWNPFTRPFMAAPFHPVSNDVTKLEANRAYWGWSISMPWISGEDWRRPRLGKCWVSIWRVDRQCSKWLIHKNGYDWSCQKKWGLPKWSQT